MYSKGAIVLLMSEEYMYRRRGRTA